MVCILAKNVGSVLVPFFRSWGALDYPKEKFRFVWIYGKSDDSTLQYIEAGMKEGKYRYEIYEEPFFDPGLRSALYNADAANYFKRLYNNEPYVIMADADIQNFPSGLIKELLGVDKDIVAPYPYFYFKGQEYFFDTYVFRWHGWTFNQVYKDGKLYDQTHPLFGDSKTPVELDSVGTFFMMKGEVLKNVSWSNPVPNLQFCWSARKKGYHVWALPYVKITHVFKDLESKYSLEKFVLDGMIKEEELLKVGYVYNKKTQRLELKTW
jgi:hypothetical protein